MPVLGTGATLTVESFRERPIKNPNLKIKEITAFVPSGRDYEGAIAFYRALGFRVERMSDALAILELDDRRFFLQNFQNKIMQKNMMMNLEVENLDDWWEKIRSTGLTEKFEGVKVKPPADYPWGKREIHLVDPAGILWHISASD